MHFEIPLVIPFWDEDDVWDVFFFNQHILPGELENSLANIIIFMSVLEQGAVLYQCLWSTEKYKMDYGALIT